MRVWNFSRIVANSSSYLYVPINIYYYLNNIRIQIRSIFEYEEMYDLYFESVPEFVSKNKWMRIWFHQISDCLLSIFTPPFLINSGELSLLFFKKNPAKESRVCALHPLPAQIKLRSLKFRVFHCRYLDCSWNQLVLLVFNNHFMFWIIKMAFFFLGSWKKPRVLSH